MFRSSTVVGAGVVLVLLVASTRAFSQHRNMHEGAMGRAFPCPEEADILPCTCTYDTTSSELSLSCANTDGATLKNIFTTAVFPFSDFGSLRLENCDIGVLETGMFGPLTFESVEFNNNIITEVQGGALIDSAATLTKFTMVANRHHSPGPWPLPMFSSYTNLLEFSLDGLYDTLPPLGSTPLTTFTLHSPLLTTLDPTTFSQATRLAHVTIQGTMIDTIPTNTFNGLNALETVDLSKGKITTLPANSMSFTSPVLTLVDLSANAISTIEVDAFVVQPQTVIDLSSNQVTTLPENVFEPLVTAMTDGYVNVADNPLLCGCDLVWIVKIGDSIALQGLDSACDMDGHTMQEILDFLEYQCSPPARAP